MASLEKKRAIIDEITEHYQSAQRLYLALLDEETMSKQRGCVNHAQLMLEHFIKRRHNKVRAIFGAM